MAGKPYHKIDSLWVFDNTKKEFIKGSFRNEAVELLKNCLWTFTEKIHGTNLRVMWDGYSVTVGGRSEKSQFSKRQQEFINKVFLTKDIELVFEQLFGEKEVVVYGEMFGYDINEYAKLYSEEYDFRVFDVLVGNVYLQHRDIYKVATALGFKVAPIALCGTIDQAIEYVKATELSTFSMAPIEGVVGVPAGGFFDRVGKRVIVKIKKDSI